MTGKIVARQRESIAGGLQTRIGTQVVAVIGVLIAAGDLEYTLPNEVGMSMVDIALMSVIRQRFYDAVHDPDLGFRLPQQQGTPIAGRRAAVKIGFNLPP